MQVVLDTNVVISGLGRATSPPGQILQLWRRGAIELITSHELVAEYRIALGYPKVQAFLNLSDAEVDEALLSLEVADIQVDIGVPERAVPADPDDDIVVATAIAGEADFIVSGDRHLLDYGAFQGIKVITPAFFLALLESDL